MTVGGEGRSRRLVCVGLTTLDLLQLADELPSTGHKATATASRFDVGGPAGNAAITASLLGGGVTLVTVLGFGQLPEYARTILERHRVTVVDCAPAASLPVASVWVDAGSGERTILAENNADLEVVRGQEPLLPPDTAAVLLDGHYPGLAVAAATEARDKGIPIMVDCGRWRPVFADLLPGAADIIMCADFRPPGIGAGSDAALVAAIAEKWGPAMCAMTRGSEPILVAEAGTMLELAVPQVEVVDTTGAGDVLHGAYLYYRYGAGVKGLAALESAAGVASRACQRLGARVGPAARAPGGPLT